MEFYLSGLLALICLGVMIYVILEVGKKNKRIEFLDTDLRRAADRLEETRIITIQFEVLLAAIKASGYSSQIQENIGRLNAGLTQALKTGRLRREVGAQLGLCSASQGGDLIVIYEGVLGGSSKSDRGDENDTIQDFKLEDTLRWSSKVWWLLNPPPALS